MMPPNAVAEGALSYLEIAMWLRLIAERFESREAKADLLEIAAMFELLAHRAREPR